MAAQPGRRLSTLAAELSESRLDALDTGELTASLRAVFGASYRSLDAASAFRLLGLAPADDIGRAAAIALSRDARPLRVLCAVNLLEENLCWASSAMGWVSPHEAYLRPPAGRSGGPQLRFADGYAARAWLDAERTTMLARATGAPEALAGHVVRLLAALWRYLYVSAHHHEALTLHTAALALAPSGTLQQGLAHEAVGTTLIMLGRYDETVSHFEQALTIGRIGSAAEPR